MRIAIVLIIIICSCFIVLSKTCGTQESGNNENPENEVFNQTETNKEYPLQVRCFTKDGEIIGYAQHLINTSDTFSIQSRNNDGSNPFQRLDKKKYHQEIINNFVFHSVYYFEEIIEKRLYYYGNEEKPIVSKFRDVFRDDTLFQYSSSEVMGGRYSTRVYVNGHLVKSHYYANGRTYSSHDYSRTKDIPVYNYHYSNDSLLTNILKENNDTIALWHYKERQCNQIRTANFIITFE